MDDEEGGDPAEGSSGSGWSRVQSKLLREITEQRRQKRRPEAARSSGASLQAVAAAEGSAKTAEAMLVCERRWKEMEERHLQQAFELSRLKIALAGKSAQLSKLGKEPDRTCISPSPVVAPAAARDSRSSPHRDTKLLQDELNLQRLRSEELERSLQAVSNREQKIIAQNRELQENYKKASEDCSKHERECEKLREELSLLRESVGKVESVMSLLQAENSELHQKAIASSSRFEEELRRRDEESKRIKQESQAADELCKALQEKSAQLTERLANIQSDRYVLDDQLSAAMEHVEQLEAGKKSLDEEIQLKSEYITQLLEEVNRMQCEGDEANRRLRFAAEKEAKLESECRSLSQLLSNAEEEWERDKEGHRARIKEYRGVETKLNEKICLLQQLHLSLEHEHEALLNVSHTLQRKLDEAEEELEITRRQNATTITEASNDFKMEEDSSKRQLPPQNGPNVNGEEEGTPRRWQQQPKAEAKSVLEKLHSTLKERGFFYTDSSNPLSNQPEIHMRENLTLAQVENGQFAAELSSKIACIKELEDQISLRDEWVKQAEAEVLRLRQENESLSLKSSLLLQGLEDEVRTLQTQNQHLGDEVAALAKEERRFLIALRFLRAQAFYLLQKLKELREDALKKTEREKLLEAEIRALQKSKEETKARSESVLESERERATKLDREATLLREELKRQAMLLIDRAEEKREAIRQLCFALDVMWEKNREMARAWGNAGASLKCNKKR